MSLSSLLLGSVKNVDNELDALFKTNAIVKPATVIPIPGTSKNVSKKRKLEADERGSAQEPVKRPKPSPKRETSVKSKVSSPATHITQIPQARKHSKAVKGKGKEKAVSDEEEHQDENNSDLENEYLSGPVQALEGDESENQSELVHESVKSKGKHATGPKQKFVSSNETPEQRDRRTIFVGNLPLGIAQKKQLLKQLHRHILALVPTAKIESTRLRSIPFQAPTSKLPMPDEEVSTKKTAEPATKSIRAHDRDRMAAWRQNASTPDEEDLKKDEKKFLNPNQKKKIAFINQEFHSTADSVNAYVVFAHPIPSENRASNLPPLPPVMDPYEAACLAAEKCDGTLFMERMIRVDLIGKGKRDTLLDDKTGHGLVDTDPKLSIFVGNLDFASKEEDLRAFFESLLHTERGPPPTSEEEPRATDIALAKKPKTWVIRVRIVRDKETQLGKGFAYIQFADRECVDEVLALEEVKLKFAKRKLRVERCKIISGGAAVKFTTEGKDTKPSRNPVVVPKGDPLLGERLAGLSKDNRKQIKSNDADRVARRLAKKKARMSMSAGSGAVKTNIKSRERVRKGSATGRPRSDASSSGKKEGKRRVRSDKSMAERNAKK